MLWTVLNSFGPGFFGSFGAWPQSMMNLSSGPYLATRVPPYPSVMKYVPSGSHAMSVGRSNVFGPRPRLPSSPLLCTSFPS